MFLLVTAHLAALELEYHRQADPTTRRHNRLPNHSGEYLGGEGCMVRSAKAYLPVHLLDSTRCIEGWEAVNKRELI